MTLGMAARSSASSETGAFSHGGANSLMKIAAPTLGKEAKQSVQLPIPMVGVGAHVGLLLNLLEARAKITGISYSGNYLYEALADISLTPFPFLDIHAGYKVIRVHLDRNDFFLNADFAGPYVALTVSW